MKNLLLVAVSFFSLHFSLNAHADERDCWSPELSSSQATICMLREELYDLFESATRSYKELIYSEAEVVNCEELKRLDETLPQIERGVSDYKSTISVTTSNSTVPGGDSVSMGLVLMLNEATGMEQTLDSLKRTQKIIREKGECQQ